MELVEGETLKKWLKAETRSRREIIAVLAAAGEGLAAAHAQGMVHRDVKPSNVIVGDDGRVRVVNFGLARPAGVSGESGSTPSPLSDDDTDSFGSSHDRLLGTPLTRAGHVLGTPGYMAPEQYRLEEVDAQSDQYAFCVTLYEALVGQRPFRAKDASEMRDKVIAGVPDDPDELKQLPAHLTRLLRRGLSVERGQRYPSMAALLAELRFDPAARRRRIAGIAGIAVLLATTGEKLMGRYDDSFQRLEHIREIRERTLGKAHPRYGTALYNLGVHMLARGEANKAIDYLQQALQVLVAALGKNHVMVATTMSELGNMLARVDGRRDEGKKLLEQALEIQKRTVGADDPLVAGTLQALGDLATQQGHDDEARTLLERALAIRQRALPENHPKIGESLAALAGLMWDQKKYAESRAYYDRARAIYEKAYGRDHPFYAVMLLNVGDCDLELGQVNDAIRSFEQAVAALESSDGSPARLADARFALARALWRAGRERKRAKALAKAALDGYGKVGDYYADSRQEVNNWLRKPSSR